MSAAARNPKPALPRESDHLSSDRAQVRTRFLNVLAHSRADFEHRLMHLGFHLLVQQGPALGQNLRADMRPQVPRRRIDGLIFLFDSDVETRLWKILVRHIDSYRNADQRSSRDSFTGSCTFR